MGFGDVYDYVAGKADWGSAGLPLEGTLGPRIGELIRADVPRCGLQDGLRDVRQRVRSGGWQTCIVVNEAGVVLGRLGRRAIDSEGEGTVEDAMTNGPGTIRPSFTVEETLERMRKRELATMLVTRADGTLLGLVTRDDIEDALSRGRG
jgi:Mg/Co/Ni transporter MgtE